MNWFEDRGNKNFNGKLKNIYINNFCYLYTIRKY